MRLRELLKEAGYGLPAGVENCEITGVTSNSKAVRQGMLFVALRGLRHDGFAYLDEAFSRGAAFAVCEREAVGRSHLLVENAREALARLLDALYGHPARGLSLIGITGTNGKTSTATMLYAILRRAGYHCGLIGTVDCLLDDSPLAVISHDALANMTTPDPEALYALLAQMRQGGASHVIMEVTSHALAFSKTAPLTFQRGVFTNLSADHLDLHGDMESYFAEKQKLFRACKGAVVSCFSPYGRRLADSLEIPLWRLDETTLCEIRSRGADGVDLTLCDANGQKMPFSLPVAGGFSAENGALAALTALSLGVDPATVRAAFAAFTGVRGRMERVSEQEDDIAVFLDYAHTPDALERLLRTVRDFRYPEQRVVLLFGCGGDRDRSKRAEMGRIASQLADLVILTSDNCRSESPDAILGDILKGVDKEKPYKLLCDRQEAIAFAIESARSGDILLLAGKGHEEYEIRGRERLFFSERKIVRDCLARRRVKGCAD